MPMRRQRRGFTLIEMLVVVSILLVLIAILVPALAGAQEASRSAVCHGHLRGVAQALSTYMAEHFMAIPGPNTSGSYISPGYSAWRKDASEPTYNMDWVSPLLGDPLDLPEDRDERILAIFNEEFRCPSNFAFFDNAYPNISGFMPGTLAFSSYSSPLGFHITFTSSPTDVDNAIKSGNRVPRNPDSYGPRLTAVGGASGKVFAMDGARYVDYSNKAVTYNAFEWQDEGGNFMTQSPACPDTKSNGSPYKQNPDGSLHKLAKVFAYRHTEKINVVFFDGHAESLNNEESRPAKYYFPKGTQIINASYTADPDDVDGQIIQ